MDHPIPLHLPSEVFMALIDHVGEGYYGRKTEAALCNIIRKWIAGTRAQPGESEDEEGKEAENKGYQWKQLFLPNGTELRATYRGHSSYAKVENEIIVSDGQPASPSQLANANGCGARNAWRAIWLRFPGERSWRLAASCRAAE